MRSPSEARSDARHTGANAIEWCSPPRPRRGPTCAAAGRPDYELTPREREVLGLLVEACGKKEIAFRLEITVHAVDFHLRNIYGKLGVNDRVAATGKVLREQLL